MNHYFIEMTDTYGGEANYCWAYWFIVRASTPRGAMRRVARQVGDKVRCTDRYNELQTWDSRIGCIRYFVEHVDADDISRYQADYSRVEVLE